MGATMKPTTQQIIDWGRTALNETGALIPTEWNMELLEAICSAAYEAGRKDEREAIAKWYEDRGWMLDDGLVPDAIRERGAPCHLFWFGCLCLSIHTQVAWHIHRPCRR